MFFGVCMIFGLFFTTIATQSTNETSAEQWLAEYNTAAQIVYNRRSLVGWNYNTNITDHNEALVVAAGVETAAFIMEAYNNASLWDYSEFSQNVRRQFEMISRVGVSILPSADYEQYATVTAEMRRVYSTARVPTQQDPDIMVPLDPDLTQTMATSRDWDELLWAWRGWRDATGPRLKQNYTDFVSLSNQAAVLNGFSDTAESWQAKYEDESFEEDVAALWEQLLPLYRQLHAYVRRRLRDMYPDKPFPASGQIPAHILGNMWGQSWLDIANDVQPFPNRTAMDVTPAMLEQGYTVRQMFNLSEDFFMSLGMDRMPDSFWEKSMLERPADREVVCHASAWDFKDGQDFRIKQCTQINMNWLFTTHHEMGHVAYFMQYAQQPLLFRGGANPGFHEAIGDVMSLSVSTPEHLYAVGLLDEVTEDAETDLNYLMNQALRKVAFLPFGYLVDKWRWNVFRGDTPPSEYNKEWWKLRCGIQGVSPPVQRPDDGFDAGAKYHIPNNTPYIRYFVSIILQFQFHKSLCEAAGNTRPLHRCDIYNSTEAGEKLRDVLMMGKSRPWGEAMEALTGQNKMDASAVEEYFRPLMDWLEEQNDGYDVGWDESECSSETVEASALTFLENFNIEAEQVYSKAVNASWIYNTDLTDEHSAAMVAATVEKSEFRKDKYTTASAFDWRNFTHADTKRQFYKITDIGTSSLEGDDLEQVTQVGADLVRIYSEAEVCDLEDCMPLDPDLTRIMASSRDWDELLRVWKGWRDVTGRRMKTKYETFAGLLNKAAKQNNYDDYGDYLRSWYEDPDFETQVRRLYEQVLPMYRQLHTYVRHQLQAEYPTGAFPTSRHLPAHIMGNMWAQTWTNIQDMVLPYPNSPAIDITPQLVKQGYDARRMFEVSEEFFTSLRLEAMPQEFWAHSMIEKPDDRNVVCHASAWDFYNSKDFRIKQCTDITQKYLFTTHHEMGHVQYYLQYKHLPVVYRRGGNPGFHEAIGDVLSLSVSTPEHLHSLGLLDAIPTDNEGDLNFLMTQALSKIAFLPFGYLMDQWRWSVFRGDTPPSEYNQKWWDLRCQIQGISPPVDRTEEDFDPGAKFHIPNNTPYIRYFVSYIIQFQFHKALCEAAGNTSPLHRCDIYQSQAAGQKLKDVLRMGSSKPWPDAMEAITGQRTMDASAILEYFKPLTDWLEDQNKGRDVTWEEACPPVPERSTTTPRAPPPATGVNAANNVAVSLHMLMLTIILCGMA